MSFEQFSAPLSRVMNRAQSGLAFDDFTRCESPIEAMLQLGMASASRRLRIRWCAAQTLPELSQCALPNAIVVASQVRVGDYRLDFAFSHGDKRLGVECDGEEFHGPRKLAKADAERDRNIADSHGLGVLRLRGREIHRSPIDAVAQCIRTLHGYPDLVSAFHITLRDCVQVDRDCRAAVDACAAAGDYAPLTFYAHRLASLWGPKAARWQHYPYDLSISEAAE